MSGLPGKENHVIMRVKATTHAHMHTFTGSITRQMTENDEPKLDLAECDTWPHKARKPPSVDFQANKIMLYARECYNACTHAQETFWEQTRRRIDRARPTKNKTHQNATRKPPSVDFQARC